MTTFNEFLRAIAEVIRAAAWPLVVLILAYIHRARLAELLSRLRKTPVAEFDPPPPQKAMDDHRNPIEGLAALTLADATLEAAGVVTGPRATPAPPLPGELPVELQRLRTTSVARAEEVIRELPMVANLRGQAREQALLIIAAFLFVHTTFQDVDWTIWGSQLRILEFLNAAPDGLDRSVLKERFFDPAAAAFPSWFENYTFDAYLGFLARHFLVTENGRVRLTETGREFLQWRVTQRRPPKVNG